MFPLPSSEHCSSALCIHLASPTAETPAQLERSIILLLVPAMETHPEDNHASQFCMGSCIRHIPCMCIQLWWNWRCANRSFPLKIGTGTEQTRSQDLRRYGATPTRSSHLKYVLRPYQSHQLYCSYPAYLWHDCFLHYQVCDWASDKNNNK